MSIADAILMRMFGRPRGRLGRFGGLIMARMNDDKGAWAVELLEIEPNDSVLEIGFGPGVVVQYLSKRVGAGHVTGVDISSVMVSQAQARNLDSIRNGRVDLCHASVESLPFKEEVFEKALAINSMQIWPNPVAGLKELRRVIKPAGRIVLGFTPHSRQSKEGVADRLLAAGFFEPQLVQKDKGFCALAMRL